MLSLLEIILTRLTIATLNEKKKHAYPQLATWRLVSRAASARSMMSYAITHMKDTKLLRGLIREMCKKPEYR